MIVESDGRKHPVHWPAREAFNTPVIIFLTVVTKNRKSILADEAAHATVVEAWKGAKKWLVGRYILMPDHVHLFCAPGTQISEPLLRWAAFWKSESARTWPRPTDRPIWQRHFWDTQLRRGESYDEKWEYVLANPVRAGLVSRVADWPYQGELNELRW
jgi:putative transposase